MNIYKIIKWSAVGICCLSGVLWIWLINSSDSDSTSNVPMEVMFWLAYLLTFVSVVAALYTGLSSMGNSKEERKNLLIHVGIFFGVFVISYLLSMGEATRTDVLVSTGIIAFYIYMAISILLLIYTGVIKALKK